MDCYIQLDAAGAYRASWELGGGRAFKLGVADPLASPADHAQAHAGEPEVAALRRVLPQYFEPIGTDQLVKITLAANEYHPRIARPQCEKLPSQETTYPDRQALREIVITQAQIGVLAGRLQTICQTIHPEGPNLAAYGHEIRNLLILASTEVEAMWRSVLVSNNAATPTARLNTNDYIKLCGPMRLREYGVYFSIYPWLGNIRPFVGWNSTHATRSLSWYDAYNDVKHDREGKFAHATLQHAVDAVAACLVMFIAQYGAVQIKNLWARGVHMMNVIEFPNWQPEECYLMPLRWNGSTFIIPTPQPVNCPL